MVFRDYAQPGNQITLAFDPATRKIASLNISTYMGETKGAVTLQAQMVSLPDGTNFEYIHTVRLFEIEGDTKRCAGSRGIENETAASCVVYE